MKKAVSSQKLPVSGLYLEVLAGIPEMFFKILNPVIDYFYTFLFQQLLHPVVVSKVRFSCQQPLPVDYSVGRDVFVLMCSIHGPPDHSGTPFTAKVACDGTVGTYPAFRYQPDYLVNQIKKVRFFFIHAPNQ